MTGAGIGKLITLGVSVLGVMGVGSMGSLTIVAGSGLGNLLKPSKSRYLRAGGLTTGRGTQSALGVTAVSATGAAGAG